MEHKLNEYKTILGKKPSAEFVNYANAVFGLMFKNLSIANTFLKRPIQVITIANLSFRTVLTNLVSMLNLKMAF